MPTTYKVPLPLPNFGFKGSGMASLPSAGHQSIRAGDSCPLQASLEHSTLLADLGLCLCPWKGRRETVKPGPYAKVTHFEEIPSLFRGKGADTSLRLKGSKRFRDSNPELA